MTLIPTYPLNDKLLPLAVQGVLGRGYVALLGYGSTYTITDSIASTRTIPDWYSVLRAINMAVHHFKVIDESNRTDRFLTLLQLAVVPRKVRIAYRPLLRRKL